jgi:DNA polymerase III alpha subunit (gram-positive type)
MIALILDTETTGLLSNHTIALTKQPSVIEYYGACVDLQKQTILSELELLIKPAEFPMSAKTIEETKTRLSNELLAPCQPFHYHSEAIRQQIESAPLVIAHNLSFDKEMLDIEFERLRQKLVWPKRLVCSVEQTIHLLSRRLSLTDLHVHLFAEGFSEAHRAKPDTQALMRSAFKLYEMELL